MGLLGNIDPMLLGASLLAGNKGHYGAFAPAFGEGLLGYRNQLLAEQKAKALEAYYKTQGAGSYGKSPMYATNAAGDVIALQLGSGGDSKQVQLPPGFEAVQPQQFLPLGDKYQGVSKHTGAPTTSYDIEPGPEQQPEFRRKVKEQEALGAEQGKLDFNVDEVTAAYPRLQRLVVELSGLGQKATHTMAGRATDTARRELGLPVGEGAVARKAYTSKVDNEVLPLLRATFGAQFTVKEGEWLRATLGDVNASPEEKDEVLKSFINAKYELLQTKLRQAGRPEMYFPKIGLSGYIVPTDEEFANLKSGDLYEDPDDGKVYRKP